jgi:hypothetical protein
MMNFFFFLIKAGKGEKRNYKGESFPQLILTEEKRREEKEKKKF